VAELRLSTVQKNHRCGSLVSQAHIQYNNYLQIQTPDVRYDQRSNKSEHRIILYGIEFFMAQKDIQFS